MVEVTESYVPDLSEHLSIMEFDRTSYLVCVDNGKDTKLKISALSKLLLDQIDGKRSVEEITQSFNEHSGVNLPTQTVISIFNSQLMGYGVFKGDGIERVRVKDNYLKLRFTLFPESFVIRMVQPFLALFQRRVFITLFITCLCFLSVLFLSELNLKTLYANVTPSLGLWFVGLNVLSIIFHELGHAGACVRYGARSGAIGFGFYLFTPVFYADVSDAWRLKRFERLTVDLAGIYMQLLFCSVFGIVYLATHEVFYLYISFLIAATVIVNINPFLRYDGYWALCDIANVPNLRENSTKLMKQLFRRIIAKPNQWKPGLRNALLAIYAMASFAFIAYFLVLMLVWRNSSLLNFPLNLYAFFEKLVTAPRTVNFDWLKTTLSSFILPALFYFMAFRMVLRPVFKTLKNRYIAYGL